MKDEEQMAGKHRTIRSLIYGLIASVCLSAILHAATGSTIVLTPNEKIVCTVNQDSGSISLWNRLELGEVCEVAVGDEPRTLAVSPDGHTIYVTTQRSQTLAIEKASAQRRLSWWANLLASYSARTDDVRSSRNSLATI
jgi:DNA-binding beta-propeller fold protein YncE